MKKYIIFSLIFMIICYLIKPCVYATDTLFSRGSFCDMIVQTVGLKTDVSSAEKYEDVNENDEYYNSIMIMLELGYMRGYEDGTFRPLQVMTNGEVAKVLSTVLFGYNFTVPEDVDCYELYDYHWASRYIWKVENSGVMYNVSDWTDYCRENNLNYSLIEEIASQGITHTYGGTCGNDLTWELTHTGTLTIAGKGEMHTYSKSNRTPWYPYIESINKVIMLDNVTSIGNYAFYNCTNLDSITIPNSINSIGSAAFSGCLNLNKVFIKDLRAWCSIEFVDPSSNPFCCGGELYLNGNRVTDIIIPDNVTSIGDWAFSECSNLVSVTIPNSVTNIGKNAFYGCNRLESITIPDSVTNIGNYAFAFCYNLVSITIPESVTSIGDSTFCGCRRLENITIPNSVISIGDSAFYGCKSIVNFTIPDRVISIGDSAFGACRSLLSISIGNGLTSIGDRAFSFCDSLENIIVDKSNPNYSMIEDVLFSKNNRILIRYPESKDDVEYVIPKGVTDVANSAFSECNNLVSVTIPDTVTNIGGFAFSNCYNLTNITIPDSVTSIGEWAFSSCESFTNITIPKGVTRIANYAFYNCQSLVSVVIPKGVTNIGMSSFDGCDNLKDVYYNGTEEEWNKISIGSYNNSLTNATIHYKAVEYRINSITIKDMSGNSLEAIPTGLFLASIYFTNVSSSEDTVIILAQYTDEGAFKNWESIQIGDVPMGYTIKLSFPVDNSKGDVAGLKAFCWESFGNMIPMGNMVSFPTK